jgi:hypothetical protein
MYADLAYDEDTGDMKDSPVFPRSIDFMSFMDDVRSEGV